MPGFTPGEKKLLDAALRFAIDGSNGSPARRELEELRKKVARSGEWHEWQDLRSDHQVQGQRLLCWSPDAHPKVFIARWSKGKWRADGDGRTFEIGKVAPLPEPPVG